MVLFLTGPAVPDDDCESDQCEKAAHGQYNIIRIIHIHFTSPFVLRIVIAIVQKNPDINSPDAIVLQLNMPCKAGINCPTTKLANMIFPTSLNTFEILSLCFSDKIILK